MFEDGGGMIEAMQASLEAAGFTDVNLSTDSEGALIVEGAVANSEEEQMVIDLIMSSGIEDVDFFLTWTDEEAVSAEEEAWDDSYDPEADNGEQSYTVARGDSYWKIAVKFYGKGKGKYYTQIQEANDNKKVIHPGDVLTIPVLQA